MFLGLNILGIRRIWPIMQHIDYYVKLINCFLPFIFSGLVTTPEIISSSASSSGVSEMSDGGSSASSTTSGGGSSRIQSLEMTESETSDYQRSTPSPRDELFLDERVSKFKVSLVLFIHSSSLQKRVFFIILAILSPLDLSFSWLSETFSGIM